ncbi:hypothetical protein HK097_001827 [Rhizophlyctis rosea]|uniref:Uncharacterized protein n=1 Tax=Rhizophlyctis rosea TaxID=64517 RepID=A0AAD5WYQ3_9FUNG|nr:hypothetical protein HK097_001827 [Rhizophlyctis rosea]
MSSPTLHPHNMYQNTATPSGKRIVYPYADRNKDPILSVLKSYLKPGMRELSSGSGQHTAHFAHNLPQTHFTPSELPLLPLQESISSYTSSLPNVSAPRTFDILTSIDWDDLVSEVVEKEGKFDAVFVANLMHISEWEVTRTLAERLGRVVKDGGGRFLVYGPFNKDGGFTSSGNEEFDNSLKQRNPAWGLRDIADVEKEFKMRDWTLEEVHDMPSNNFTLVFKR